MTGPHIREEMNHLEAMLSISTERIDVVLSGRGNQIIKRNNHLVRKVII